MKPLLRFQFWLGRAAIVVAISAAVAFPAQAAIVLTGPTTYVQNFDGLGTTTVPWLDDTGGTSTLPGWIAGINANGTPDGNLQVTNGTDATALTALLNLGTAGAADRALGSKATSTGAFANIAYGVLFQNTSANSLLVTTVRYSAELWRTNSTAAPGVGEVWTTFFKTSPAPILDVEPGGSSATADPGTFTPADSALNWTSTTTTPAATAVDGNAPANRQVLTSDLNVTILPGEYFMFRWVDPNLGGTDGYQGIDDVSITIVPEPASVGFLLVGAMSLLVRSRRRSGAS
jgi:hypothetical protein